MREDPPFPKLHLEAEVKDRWAHANARLAECRKGRGAGDRAEAADWKRELTALAAEWAEVIRRRRYGDLTETASIEQAQSVVDAIASRYEITARCRVTEYERKPGEAFSVIWWFEIGYDWKPEDFNKGRWRLFLGECNDELKRDIHCFGDYRFNFWPTERERREIERMEDADDVKAAAELESRVRAFRESAAWAFLTWVWNDPFVQEMERRRR